MVKRKAAKAAKRKSVKKPASVTTKNATVAKPSAGKSKTLRAMAMTDDGVTL